MTRRLLQTNFTRANEPETRKRESAKNTQMMMMIMMGIIGLGTMNTLFGGTEEEAQENHTGIGGTAVVLGMAAGAAILYGLFGTGHKPQTVAALDAPRLG